MNHSIRFKNIKTLLFVAALLAAILPAVIAKANPFIGFSYGMGQYFSQLNTYQNSQDPSLQMTLAGSNFVDLMNYSRMVQSAQNHKNKTQDYPDEFDVGQDLIPITPEERIREMMKSETLSERNYAFSNSANPSENSIGIVSGSSKDTSINESFMKIYTFEDFMKEPVSADLERAIRNTPPLPATRAWDLEAIGLRSGGQVVF